jgi:hypothetical protein
MCEDRSNRKLACKSVKKFFAYLEESAEDYVDEEEKPFEIKCSGLHCHVSKTYYAKNWEDVIEKSKKNGWYWERWGSNVELCLCPLCASVRENITTNVSTAIQYNKGNDAADAIREYHLHYKMKMK